MATREEATAYLKSKIVADEPVFILRARDYFAPELIEDWADRVDKAWSVRERSPAGVAFKIKKARALAHEMRAWQALNGSKTPD